MLKFKTLSYLFILPFIFILSGCEKEINDSDNTVRIPPDFDYSLTKDIDITVKVDHENDGKYYYKVEIFDSIPIINPEANLISKGIANPEQDYEATATILKTNTYIYIRQTYPDGQSVTKKAETSEDKILVNFEETSVKSITKSSSNVYSEMFKDGKYSSWLSTNNSYNVYTYLFEDCWPNLGDYDMNDLVMDIQNISYSKNTKNYIESMTITVVLRADGGVYKLAGAIQLDGIESGDVSSISRESEVNLTGEVFKRDPKNGTESKQKHAVIPLFDEAHAALGASSQSMTNTIKDGGNKTASKTINLTINFNDKTNITSSELSLKKLNVFIVGY
ncbi:MAG: LruC domain-containing protein, partial [Prolixibacteraceae bacterium]|nr:LruC domain-containing protein [Prolixibacteraceae bacterium]